MKISPGQVFLLDGTGALLTAFLTGVVLTRFEPYFRMPPEKCYVLGVVAVIFSVYSFLCALRLSENYAPYLKFIAITNGIYVLITSGFVVYYFETLTGLGITYFVAEALVVGWVIALEWRVAKEC